MPFVLIESDWNLKSIPSSESLNILMVLIESDWNLKQDFIYNTLSETNGINRIRLEFKDVYFSTY